MDPLVIDIDFGNVSPFGQTVRGYPEDGLNEATIRSYMKYDNDDGTWALYVNLTTGNIDHRERFNSSHLGFLMGHLVALGIPEADLKKGGQIPFHKLAGKKVYFDYTRPNLLPDGTAAQGSYPKYRWMAEALFNKAKGAKGEAKKAAQEVVESGDFAVEDAPPNGADNPPLKAQDTDVSWILGN